MIERFSAFIDNNLADIKAKGLDKTERIITSGQQPLLQIDNNYEVVNFCSNNYLGLANHRHIISAAKQGMDEHGYGMASVRFICGTQDIHKELESKISSFLKMEDTILYSSCFDANTGLFETLLESQDAIISDTLNHASVIDGIRLCKAMRFRYQNNNMDDLKVQLKTADQAGARFKLIATDGVFSMDGIIANLDGICNLAEKYNAMVMVDDSHAVGLMGNEGRGTHEYCGAVGRVDIITGTLGKALGGAAGGFTAAKRPVVDWLRQRSRPYLFSNSLAPPIVSASLKALELLKNSDNLRQQLNDNATYFREKMTTAGFTLAGADHPIIPIMIGNAKLAAEFANRLLQSGIYVVGFSFPVVPEGKARIRTQMSAAHTSSQLDRAIEAFIKIGTKLKIIS